MQQKLQYALRYLCEDLSKAQMDAPPMGTYPALSGAVKYAEDNVEFYLQLLEQRQLALISISYFAAPSTGDQTCKIANPMHFGRLKAKFACGPVYLLTKFLCKWNCTSRL